MTSNAGAQSITSTGKHLGFAADTHEKSNTDIKEKAMAALKDLFRPEFLNRIDEIIVFNKLTEDEIATIAGKMLGDVADRIEKIGVKIHFTDELLKHLAKAGFDPVYGARPLRREIQRTVEDSFSEKMLAGDIKAGDSVTADIKDGKIVFEK